MSLQESQELVISPEKKEPKQKRLTKLSNKRKNECELLNLIVSRHIAEALPREGTYSRQEGDD